MRSMPGWRWKTGRRRVPMCPSRMCRPRFRRRGQRVLFGMHRGSGLPEPDPVATRSGCGRFVGLGLRIGNTVSWWQTRRTSQPRRLPSLTRFSASRLPKKNPQTSSSSPGGKSLFFNGGPKIKGKGLHPLILTLTAIQIPTVGR